MPSTNEKVLWLLRAIDAYFNEPSPEGSDSLAEEVRELIEDLADSDDDSQIRDCFAMSALGGLLSRTPPDESVKFPIDWKRMAKQAYGLADACMAARNTTQPQVKR